MPYPNNRGGAQLTSVGGRAATPRSPLTHYRESTDTNSVFTATITMVGGVPVVEWSPKLSAAEASRRSYTVYGKTNLTDKAWHSPTNEASRFFWVGVEMR